MDRSRIGFLLIATALASSGLAALVTTFLARSPAREYGAPAQEVVVDVSRLEALIESLTETIDRRLELASSTSRTPVGTRESSETSTRKDDELAELREEVARLRTAVAVGGGTAFSALSGNLRSARARDTAEVERLFAGAPEGGWVRTTDHPLILLSTSEVLQRLGRPDSVGAEEGQGVYWIYSLDDGRDLWLHLVEGIVVVARFYD